MEGTCRHCKDAIVKQDSTGEWVDVNGLSSCAPLAAKHVPIGCPDCGRSDMIQVTAEALVNVGVAWEEPHQDFFTWGVSHDVDLGDATRVTCQACQFSTPVDGDSSLFHTLGLETE